tara:strand:- start:701 stop:1114 length:414 start_codon:yes stop_codon:yes gene_type:complete
MNRRIILTELKKIHLKDGDVFHCLKKGDNGYVNFGELYFSRVNFNKIKGWKRHRKITLNLVVPYGEVEFIFAHEDNKFSKHIIGTKNYKRLTIPPGLWFCFQGKNDPFSIIASVIDHPHDPTEVDNKELNYFNYEFK